MTVIEFEKPEPQLICDPWDKPPSHWCWVVTVRMWFDGFELSPDAASQWSDWTTIGSPSHFRSETGAAIRKRFLEDRDAIVRTPRRKEFRVEPKYLGYIPGEDEKWISP